MYRDRIPCNGGRGPTVPRSSARCRRGLYALAVITVLVAAAAILLYGSLTADLPQLGTLQAQSGAQSTLIADRHGRLLYEIIDPLGSKHVPLPLSEIPLACRQATIATEDSRFYSHPGVDLLAILRAAWQNWRGRSNAAANGSTVYQIVGASTLTQQLARNLYLSEDERTERSLRRKLREAWLAWRLEQLYSKDDILALYLNNTYYGHFAVGVEAAAQAYFGLHAWELDLAQCALLAGLPQYPAGYNPVENPLAARSRQAVVLGLMAKDGYISPAKAEDAQGERLAYTSTPFPIEAPHFVLWVQGQLETMFPAAQLRAGGLRVTTTLDLDWQQHAEEIVRRRLAQLQPCRGEGIAPACDPQADPTRRVEDAALVALEPHSGAVLAMVGSPDYFDPKINGAVNAALSLRQPGSAIKPITYAAALDPERARAAGREPWTPATLIADLRTVFQTAEGRPYVPQNYDRQYHGPVSVRTALANSYNIPAVKTLQHIGVEALIDQAARMGIPWNLDARSFAARRTSSSRSSDVEDATRLRRSSSEDQGGVPKDEEGGQSRFEQPASGFGLALTLGGGEVRLLDLAAAYGVLANGGYRVTTYAISRVETLDGEVLFDIEDATRLRRSSSRSPDAVSGEDQRAGAFGTALDPRVAYLITDILSDDNARLPAFGPGNLLEIGRPAAAKTGTTTDWRDNWTIGYTPDLVTGVWVGNADNTPMRDVSGISGAGPIWHDFMLTVLRDTPPREFPRPDGLVRVEVCADSGLLPPSAANEASVGRPTALAGLSQTTGSRQSDNPQFMIRNLQPPVPCPMRRFEWFIAGTEPSEVDTSQRQMATDTRTENAGSSTTLTLTSPDHNAVYHLDPGLPASAQQLPVTAVPGPELWARTESRDVGGSVRVTLLLDGQPFASVGDPDYTAWWPLTRGQHTFQAIATRPDGSQVASEPVTVVVE